MKKIIILIFILSTILCTILCGRKASCETITVYSRSTFVFDNIDINLKRGYWVEDYDIDYENNVIILDLYKEELSD